MVCHPRVSDAAPAQITQEYASADLRELVTITEFPHSWVREILGPSAAATDAAIRARTLSCVACLQRARPRC
jgi:hypothetical protein